MTKKPAHHRGPHFEDTDHRSSRRRRLENRLIRSRRSWRGQSPGPMREGCRRAHRGSGPRSREEREACNRARRAERISFDAIRDDGVSRLGGETFTYKSSQEYYEEHQELYNGYERSWHADQPAFVQVLCEAAGIVPCSRGRWRVTACRWRVRPTSIA
jgi:hypothetical protein